MELGWSLKRNLTTHLEFFVNACKSNAPAMGLTFSTKSTKGFN
jgi:hypothetical protein